MQNPANCVVDKLGLRERLVTALMSQDPEAGHDKTVRERIKRPQSKASERVEVGVRKADVLGRNKRVRVFGSLVNGGDQDEIPDTDGQRVSCDGRVKLERQTYT